MDLNKEKIEEIVKAIVTIAQIEEVNNEDVVNKKDLYEQLLTDVPDAKNLNKEELLQLFKINEGKNRSAENRSEGSDLVQKSNSIEIYAPKVVQYNNSPVSWDGEVSMKQFGTFNRNIYDFLIQQMKEMVTSEHVVVLEYKKDGKTVKKYWLTIQFCKDLFCLINNIEVYLTTSFITIPVLNDVMVLVTAKVVNKNRNTVMDGITACEYLYKQRVMDSESEDPEVDRQFGDQHTIEKAQTRAMRRACEWFVPPIFMAQIEELLKEKFYSGDKNKAQIGKVSRAKKTSRHPKKADDDDDDDEDDDE